MDGEMKNSCKILVETPDGKGLLGRARSKWEENIRIDLRGIG
jgi:hypothetical protein